MSITKKIEVSEVGFEEALNQITELSNGKNGLIVNKNARSGLSSILTGENKEIENIAKNENNFKEVKKNIQPLKPKKEVVSKKENKKNNIPTIK